MKIAYLIHTQTMSNELVRVIRKLTQTSDHVFLMVNQDDQRQEAYFELSTNHRVHIEQDIPYATEGDLSLTRFYLHMMKKALEMDHFKYFINLQTGMAPLQNEETIHNFLEEHYPTNFYTLYPHEVPQKYLKRYYPFTNFISFGTSKFTRAWSTTTAAILNILTINRKSIKTTHVGSQYFIISDQGAKQLVEHLIFCTDNYKLGWYPEQTCLPTMFESFMTQPNLNAPFLIGPDNNIHLWQSAQSLEIDYSTANQLFGGTFNLEQIRQIIKNY